MTQSNYPRSNKRVWTGIFIIGIGIFLLAQKMGFPFPNWFFDWPMILIAIGLFSGLQNGFRNSAWFILIFLGVIFLVDDNIQGMYLHRFLWPVGLIFFGIFIIFRRNKCNRQRHFNRPGSPHTPTTDGPSPVSPDDDNNFIEMTTFLGGIKKKILSKNFKGGNIVCFMGGTELDLTLADIQQPAVLEISQIFGGTKLMVPSNWEIQSEVSAVLGGFEDKRNIASPVLDTNKVLILKGTSVFGGIEITSN